jgi:hypothetical protein
LPGSGPLQLVVRGGKTFKRRPRATAADRDEHGTLARYRCGCRCPSCRTAQRDYYRVWRAARKLLDGLDPEWRVPAGPVRRRVDALQAAGLSLLEIARRAGVHQSTVYRVRRRSTRRVDASTAHAIAAVSA